LNYPSFLKWLTVCIRQFKTCLEREHSILLSVTRALHVYQVCHGVGRCVKDESCSLSSLEWKLMDCINGISDYLNKCHTLSNTSRMTFFLSGQQCIGGHALCIQHSPTVAALSTSFLLNHAPLAARSWTHWLQDLRSLTAAWVWVVSQKDWRNQGTTSWILAMHWCSICVKKMRFLCFPILPGSAEAQVIRGGTVKRLLIAYFIGNISAKKNIKMRSRKSSL